VLRGPDVARGSVLAQALPKSFVTRHVQRSRKIETNLYADYANLSRDQIQALSKRPICFFFIQEKYSVFYQFRHANFENGGSILSSNQVLPQKNAARF
jgi:hypothetical protein